MALSAAEGISTCVSLTSRYAYSQERSSFHCTVPLLHLLHFSVAKWQQRIFICLVSGVSENWPLRIYKRDYTYHIAVCLAAFVNIADILIKKTSVSLGYLRRENMIFSPEEWDMLPLPIYGTYFPVFSLSSAIGTLVHSSTDGTSLLPFYLRAPDVFVRTYMHPCFTTYRDMYHS